MTLHRYDKLLALTAAALLLTAVASGQGHDHKGHSHGANESQPGHSHAESSLHGGNAVMTREFHFETVFDASGVRVYGYSYSQKPISLQGVTGKAAIEVRGGEKVSVDLEYVPATKEAQPGVPAMDFLKGRHDLSAVAPGDAKATITLQGLKGKKEKRVQFRATYAAPASANPTASGYVCPMHPEVKSGAPGKCPKCGMNLEPAR